MIGKKFYKNDFSSAEYSECANWCNEAQKARIEDKGDYYECVAKPEITVEELKTLKLYEINSACDRILNDAALAAGRGITLDDLVQRVIAKHTAFSELSGYVIGQRQALEDRLDA